MSPHLEALLRPSLGATSGKAPYSSTMIFVGAFFGGPLAACAGFAMNVHRLSRWRADTPWLVLALFAVLGSWAWQSAWRLDPKLIERGLAIALALAGLWRHRLEQRSADLMGTQRPNGWLPGLGLVLIAPWAQSQLKTWFPSS